VKSEMVEAKVHYPKCKPTETYILACVQHKTQEEPRLLELRLQRGRPERRKVWPLEDEEFTCVDIGWRLPTWLRCWGF